MSILKIAVDNHLKREQLNIRQLLEAAYLHQYGHHITPGVLDEDVVRWEKGIHNLPYLYDYLMGTECSH